MWNQVERNVLKRQLRQLMNSKETKAAYEFFSRVRKKYYRSVYTSGFQDICKEHNDWFGEDVAE